MAVLFSLAYTSKAQPATSDDLSALMRQSRRRNALTQVTGLLLCQDGTFVQLLEGRKDVLESLYAKIQTDPRHHDVVTVRAQPLSERQFPDWSMGLADVPAGPVTEAINRIEVSTGRARPMTTTDTEAVFLRELLDLLDA